jgi:tetratricopeptide (TPR) repeat protein
MAIENADQLNNQALEFATAGSYPEAIACFKRAITIDAANFLLWFNLGITFREAGNLDRAKGALEQAYFLADDDELISSEVVENLAMVCFARKDFSEALEYYEEALAINDQNARCWNNLGVLCFNSSDFPHACNAFEAAVTIDPYYEDALINLRDTYRELGNPTGVAECERKLRSCT